MAPFSLHVEVKMAFDRTMVSMDIERSIVSLLILNDEFCKQVLPSCKIEYFESQWARPVVQWVQEHFHIYGTAPKDNIRQIYNANYDSFKDSQDAEGVQIFLDTIPDSYRDVSDVEFHVNRAAAYFKKRSLICLRDEVSLYIDNSKYDAAEQTIMGYRQVSSGFSHWLKPSDFIGVIARSIEVDENPLLQFRGALGNFIGPLQRRWVVLWLGPPKRGKSNYLVETVITALTQNLKVAVFSHEMSEMDWIPRFIGALNPGTENCDEILFPVFDCFKNATNSCSKAQRRGSPYYDSTGAVSSRYVPCNECMGTPDYDCCVGHQLRKTPEQSYATRIEKAAILKKWMENNLRFVHYAPYSKSILDMEHDLNRMEYAENFIPDIIIDDYLGAHVCGNNRLEGRDVFNFEVQNAKRIADARNVLYVGAIQGNRGAINKRRLGQEDVAEDIRLMNAVDVCIGINQVPQEKRDGIIRFNPVAHRHKSMAVDEECTGLQNLSTGNILLDTRIGAYKTTEQRLSEQSNS